MLGPRVFSAVVLIFIADFAPRMRAGFRKSCGSAGRATTKTPAQFDGSQPLAHFSTDEAVELTLDVMRNAANKVAVALGADGHPVYS